jgi:hypothetical protein
MTVAIPQTRFDLAFAARRAQSAPGLIPYFTAGYPLRDSLVDLLMAAERMGCIAAEVGIPFSDPLADGPTIQRTGQVALRNGMTLATALTQVTEARARGVSIPLAVMTYVNPVLSFGVEAFAREASASGVDGAILPDLPLDDHPGSSGAHLLDRRRVRVLRRRHRCHRRAAKHRRRRDRPARFGARRDPTAAGAGVRTLNPRAP